MPSASPRISLKRADDRLCLYRGVSIVGLSLPIHNLHIHTHTVFSSPHFFASYTAAIVASQSTQWLSVRKPRQLLVLYNVLTSRVPSWSSNCSRCNRRRSLHRCKIPHWKRSQDYSHHQQDHKGNPTPGTSKQALSMVRFRRNSGTA
jgi:hypothetical protein